jgi:hypothetical protein
MTKLRVGIIIDSKIAAEGAGGFSNFSRLIRSINEYSFHEDIEILNIICDPSIAAGIDYKKPVISIRSRRQNFLDLVEAAGRKILKAFSSPGNQPANPGYGSYEKKEKLYIESVLKENRIELVYYLRPTADILNYPFIMTHWSRGHLPKENLPGQSGSGLFNYHYFTTNILGRAFLVLCESEAAAKELLDSKACYPGKVKVIPGITAEHQTGGMEETMRVLNQALLAVLPKRKAWGISYPA